MFEQIPGFVWILSPIATALAMFYLVFTGRLIPWASHDAVAQVLQERNAEVVLGRGNWQSAASLANQTTRTSPTPRFWRPQILSTHVMSALQENASGGPNVRP